MDGTTTNYIYGNEDILLEQDNTNTTIASYVHAPGIDQPLSMTRNGQHYYYHSDMLGSITLITDDSENTVQTYEYDAYGNITQELNTNFENPYTYTARERDKESNLYYYRARYYDAGRGSFIEEDPIGLLGGINMYAYVGGNPVNYRDSFGLWSTGVHNDIIDELFPDLSENLKDSVKEGSKYVDKFQDPSESFMHAMRNGKSNQSSKHAKKLMEMFVKNNLLKYECYKNQGNFDKAYFHLGMALHPLMDSTSPSHMGFQEWYGPDLNTYDHYNNENSISDAQMQNVITTIKDAMK